MNKTVKMLINWAVYIVIGAVLVAADRITKAIIIKNVSLYDSKVVIKDFFEISHIKNTGAAWGIFSDRTDALSVVTVIACIVILLLLLEAKGKLFSLSLVMVISGAIGNLIDRMTTGMVTDFLKFYIFGYEFPNFNVADICITVGCVLLAISVLISDKKPSYALFREDSLIVKLCTRKKKEKVSTDE